MMSTRRTNVNIAKPKLGNRERRSPRRTKTPSSNELKNKYKFSPKGKRKLDFLFKGKKPGPLAGKLFYLDLNGSRYTNQLKKTIGQLGGTIEEFFRKEVTFLVTSRGECGKSPSSQSIPSPGTPSPIPRTRSSSVKNYAAASPMSTDSPQGLDTQNQVPSGTMRGKSIAQRSAGLKKGSTDILTIATTWGVNVLHVDHVLKWISQLMLKAQQQDAAKDKTSSPSKRVSQTKLPKVVALQETYIKVEDLAFKYRPLVHEFKLWPEITFDSSNVCPFDPPRRRSSENSITKRKSGEGNVKKPPIHERPKHGYCECCEVRYSDLDTHLKGRQHKEFARKDSNYVSLDKAINEGLQIEDLLKEVHLKKSNSSPNIAPVQEKNSLSVSCEDTYDLPNDDVFLLSSPHISRRNKIKVSNHTPPSKENLNNNEERQKKTSLIGDAGEGHDSISPTKRVKMTVYESNPNAKEMESPKSGPVTSLQKASSNLSFPSEGKHILLASRKRENSDKTPNVLKNTENQEHSKDVGRNKRKATEVTGSNKTFDNFNTVLEDMENERISPRRTTRKSILNLSITRKRENKNKAEHPEVQLSQDEDNNEIECKNKLKSQRTNGKICSNGFTDQSGNATLKESEEQSMTSNQYLNRANTFRYSTSTKNEDSTENNNESKRPKRESANKVDDCNQTTILKRPISDDNADDSLAENQKNEKNKNNDRVGRSRKSIDYETGVNGRKESGQQEENEEDNKLRRSNRKRNKTICEFSEREEDQQHSKDSPRLKTPTKKVSNGNHFAMCPGALIEEESIVTVRSARRRQSVVGDCKLSPISPCNLDGEYSVRSSCSEDIEFLPSGLRIYSSFGSSLGGVSKDVNHIVDRIGEFHTDGDGDGDADNENVFDPKSDPSGCGEILRHHITDASSVGSKDMVQDRTKDQVENTELQVFLTCMNADALSAVRSKDVDSSGTTIKRKRKLNDEEEPIKARKCKRLSDAEQDTLVESEYTSESGMNDSYRASVAERVKLNRAILESLQECGSPAVLDPMSSPRVQPTGRKRKNVLQSSPFSEITNTCKKRRERAKSEGRIRTSARSIVKENQNGRNQQPRSACLTPNDPFSFDDY